MDETVKPLRIPPEMPVYAENHEIFDLVQTMVSSLMADKPEDPVSYLIALLKRSRLDVPRIVLLGPPAAGKKTVARKLCAQLGSIHVTADILLKEDTPLCKQALHYIHTQQGWLLEGIPHTRQQALSLQEYGITPDHAVMLEAPDEVLLERSQGRLIDPLTGDVYHQTFIWPSDQTVAQRLEKGRSLSEKQQLADLQRYRREVTGLSSAYRHILKTVNADQPHTDVYQQVLAFVLTRGGSVAPRTPRVLLLGPPGSGKSLQAGLLSHKYNLVDVCCDQVLRSVAAEASTLGQLVKPYLETGDRVPDSLVQQVLMERLARLDCTAKGWVLHGFPRDLEQAERLQESNYIPSRLQEHCAIQFHSVSRPAPTPQVQSRLQSHPEDRVGRVQDRLREYWTHAARLQSLYPDAVHVNADQDPHRVFESLESRLVGRLSIKLTTPPETEG
ncbi:adenylate kinase 8 [Polymixia lowei]